MSKNIRLLFYVELLCIIQVLLFLFPILITERLFIVGMLIPFNGVLSLLVIKEVEKMYYKKYNTWSSLLYMICPLLGMVLLYIINAVFIKNEAFLEVSLYYVVLFTVVYLFNFIYILIKGKHKK